MSPRGTDALTVIDERTIVYLDRTGSGNETAAHLKADGRLTIMFCAFDGPPNIMRLYGAGKFCIAARWLTANCSRSAFDGVEPAGARQIVRLHVDRVQTSCGYGTPLFDYRGERPSLDNWARSKGEDGLEATAGRTISSASTASRPDCSTKFEGGPRRSSFSGRPVPERG